MRKITSGIRPDIRWVILTGIQFFFSKIKRYIRWIIFGAMLFFLIGVLRQNWQQVAAIRIDKSGWLFLTSSLVVTLLAQTWAGWVWSWMLRDFKQPRNSLWMINVYLKTNIAKYLPGNVWHYYGRVKKLRDSGVPTSTATLSVLIEPILQAAAAVLMIMIGRQISGSILQETSIWSWQIFGAIAVLTILHPWVLNPILQILGKFEKQPKDSENLDSLSWKIDNYPIKPLVGSLGFLSLRGIGFCLILLAFTNYNFSQLPMLLSAFSIAWVTALVVPGAPGGIGVFEATAIALLAQPFSTAVIFSAAALYRLISIIAETLAVGIICLDEKRIKSKRTNT
ncbi:lysylphosphatidylglycerol synthase transmembrane domain-containing protein [[Phormidium ambiguum] IAM M-71]|uniref:lysylphosphatidylglycerol synthase transmembrane domain-containing protein n=1 Tax=[Phormidium ambiguum] IAM M-71 TaxID=454136 RepID=UPI000A047170|nr:lysylphosphatidylglycerol synthase domain-containing protein [Phormidium ambiguum]